MEHSTSPKENRQNVIFRYAAEVPNDYMRKPLAAQDSEEVANIKWISFDELDTVEWAFDQKGTIERIISRLTGSFFGLSVEI